MSGSDQGLDPIGVLRRIAHLLEREPASTYRIRAYRAAALAVARLGPAEVARRARTGTLTELRGIGPRTAQVITDALHGRAPTSTNSRRGRARS